MGPVESAIDAELAAAPAWLRAQALNLARSMDEGVPNENQPAPSWLAAVSRQLTALVVQAQSLAKPVEGSTTDDLAAQRAARRARTSVPDSAAVGGVVGAGGGGAGGKRRAASGPVAGTSTRGGPRRKG